MRNTVELLHDEKCALCVDGKVGEVSVVNAQALLNGGGRTIAAAYPDHSRWMAEEKLR